MTRASAQANSSSSTVFRSTVLPTYWPDQAKYYIESKLHVLGFTVALFPALRAACVEPSNALRED